MGVTGLWQLISSTGKPVPLDSLEGKVLAVDVSVWLHQLSKGMRDGAGNPVPNAHLHGLFTRICKLLHCRIKPIFVFDGAPPELKKKTLASRRNKREDAEENSAAMQRKILTNLIRNQALKDALGEKSPSKLPPVPKGGNAGSKRDTLYELPPLPETSKAYLSHTFEDVDRGIEKRELQEFIQEEFSDLNSVDVESTDFKSLPAELQHELIEDLRASKKNYNLSKIVELPEDSKDFSNFQMEKLLKYNKLNTRLEEVRKELNTRQTHDLGKYSSEDYYGMNIDARRVVSEDTSHYMLIKGLKRKKEMEEEEMNRKSKIAKCLDVSDESSNTDELLHDAYHDDLKEMDFRKAEFKQVMEKVNFSGDKNATDRKREVKRVGDNVERFKAVIEFDSGSDSSDNDGEAAAGDDDDDDVVEIGTDQLNEKYDGDLGMSEDAELQYAIEMSLKEQNQNSKSEKMKSQKIESKKHEQYKSSLSSTKVNKGKTDSKNSKEKVLKEGSGTKKHQTETKLKPVSVDTNRQSKRITRKNAKDTQNNGENETDSSKKTMSSKSRMGSILKRRKSNMSNDSLEEENVKKRKAVVGSDMTTIADVEDTETWPKRKTVISVSDTDDVQVAVDNEDTSGSEEDAEFLEVAIDLTSVKEDELFPASMFEAAEDEPTDSGENPDRVDNGGDTIEDGVEADDDSVSENSEDDVDVYINMEDKENENNDKKITTDDTDEEEESDDIDEEKIENEVMDAKQNKSPQKQVIQIEKKRAESDSQDDTGERDEDEETEVALTEAKIDVEDESEADYVDVQVKSPKVPDLVKAFKSMEEPNIRGLKASYEKETTQLLREQGRQARMATSITDQMHVEAQELLQLFGIPFIVSPSEAEAQCAQLDKANLTQGTITDDSDIWLFGGRVVFKNFFNQAKYVECFKDVHIKSQLGLYRENLINLALLCGSDYTEGLQGIGPVTAMEVLAEFPGEGIEGLVQLKSWWEAAQNQIQIPTESKLLSKLRNLDLNPGFPSVHVVDAYLCPMVDESAEKFTWALPDLELLRHNSKLGWSKEKTDELLLPVLKRINYKKTQRAISSFFQPEVYIQPAKMKSKRLQNVVNKFLNVEPLADPGSCTLETSKTKPKPTKGKGKGKSKTSSDKDSELKDEINNETEEREANYKPAKGKRTANGKRGKGKAKHSDTEDDDNEDVDIDMVNSETKIKAVNGKGTTKRSGRGKTTEIDNIIDIEEETEVSKYFDKKRNTQPCKPMLGKGSNVGKRKDKDSKCIDSEESLESDDDISGDSGTSDSESDSESYSDMSDSDDNDITQSSLSVAEILGLKIGDSKFENMAKQSENTAGPSGVSQQMRVFESGLNVGEIMKLQSGEKKTQEYNAETDQSNSDEDMGVPSNDDKVDTEKLEDSEWENDEFYKNEGGFIREEYDKISVENTEASNVKDSKTFKTKITEKDLNQLEITKTYSTNNVESDNIITNSKLSSTLNSEKCSENISKQKNVKGSLKRRKQEIETLKHLDQDDIETQSQEVGTSKRVTRGRKSQDDNTKAKRTVVKVQKDKNDVHQNTEETNTLDTAEGGQEKVKEVSENLGNNADKTQTQRGKTLENKKTENKTMKRKPRGKKLRTVEEESELVTLEQSTEPIKRIVSGVPWADQGKKRARKGKTGGGAGGVRRHMEPVERLEKKGKTVKTAARYPVGCVNLSESDSDSSSL